MSTQQSQVRPVEWDCSSAQAWATPRGSLCARPSLAWHLRLWSCPHAPPLAGQKPSHHVRYGFVVRRGRMARHAQLKISSAQLSAAHASQASRLRLLLWRSTHFHDMHRSVEAMLYREPLWTAWHEFFSTARADSLSSTLTPQN